MYMTNKFKVSKDIVLNDYKLNNIYIQGQVLKRLLVKRKNQLLRIYKRYSRIKRFIYQQLLCGRYLYFATFTFNNENLPFNRNAFVKYLTRTCKLNFCLYCDYGELNGRFHLHGFISSDDSISSNCFNRFGYTKFEYINVDFFNFDKCVKYTIKYTNKTFYDFKLMVGCYYKSNKLIALEVCLDVHKKVYG